MPRRIVTSFSLLSMSVMLIGCSWFNTLIPIPAAMPTPTNTYTSTPTCESTIALTTTANTIKVGETLTLTAHLMNVGMPLFRLTLSSGGSVIPNGSQPEIHDDATFEIVSVNGNQFVLRGKQAGEADVTVGASGELGCYNTGYYWGAAGSEPIHLIVTP